MEPHADFLAGWIIGQDGNQTSVDVNVEAATKVMFSLGDVDFNSSDPHGEPTLRARMVRAGFDARAVGLNEAFERGKRIAGLK